MIDVEAPTSQDPTLSKKIKEILLLGLLTLTPIAVTVWVLIWIVGTLDSLVYWFFPNSVNPAILWGYQIPGLGILVTFILLLATGLLAKTYLGTFFNTLGDSVMKRLPVVGSFYSTTRQISQALFSKDSGKSFKKVVLVPFPSESSQSLAFFASHYSENQSLVFVPTAPNPTSGYVLIYKNSDMIDAPMSVDEALKIILSCGSLGASARPNKKSTATSNPAGGSNGEPSTS
jgi:uncharacterized membrane protein